MLNILFLKIINTCFAYVIFLSKNFYFMKKVVHTTHAKNNSKTNKLSLFPRLWFSIFTFSQ